MSVLVDVTNPVVVNATTAITRESPTHLRRVCLVSLGQSNLKEGEFREVFKYDYTNHIKAYSEIQKKCVAYFAQANNKGLTILELGEQPGTPANDTYTNLLDYCMTLDLFSLDDFYRWIYNVKWENKDTEETQTTLTGFYNHYQPAHPFNKDNMITWANINRLDPDTSETMIKYMDVVLPRNWRTDYYRWLAVSFDAYKVLLTLDNLKGYLNQSTSLIFNPTDYQIYLEEKGIKDTDYSSKIVALNQWITNSQNPCYIFILPNTMGDDKNLGEDLFSLYSSLTNNQYFFINYDNQNDLMTGGYATSSIFKNVQGQKSAALFVNNTQNSDLAASVAGLFASYKFDLRDTNPASPLNYKTLGGIKYQPLPQPIRQKMIQDSVNFLDYIATSLVLLNGRYGDTYPIDFRYQWDYASFQIAADLKQIILNGVNNPIYVVKYNQDGIDILKNRVRTTLRNLISLGVVTEYAESLDPADNTLVNIGSIQCIGFREYVDSHPEDYQNEIYGGISFYLRIGRYIRQVILNITLG